MNETLTPYVRSAGKTVIRYLSDPRVFLLLRALGYFLLGFVAAAGSLAAYFLPLGLGLCCQ